MAPHIRRHVLYDDSRNLYFVSLALGLFWECGPIDRARRFTSRAAAWTFMRKNGKHKDGWRVVPVNDERRVSNVVT